MAFEIEKCIIDGGYCLILSSFCSCLLVPHCMHHLTNDMVVLVHTFCDGPGVDSASDVSDDMERFLFRCAFKNDTGWLQSGELKNRKNSIEKENVRKKKKKKKTLPQKR